ncbi:MAG: hypothetical protein ABI855_09615 [Bacteroidota bacterium]
MKILSGSSEKNKSAFLIFILSCFLFLYVCVRAYCLAFTWDEAFSYLEFIHKRIFSPFYFNGVSANNHLLNTWLSHLSSSLFGVNEFTLRIPNILAYILFLFFTAKISNEFSSPLLRISSFLILNLNPYMVDYFSLSRGYGLSYGMMAGSLWYLYLYLKNDFQNKYSLRCLASAMISVFAYLTLIHFAFALLFSILLIDFLITEKDLKFKERFLSVLKKNNIAVILFMIFLLIIIPRMIGLKNAEALFYGGKVGFWHNTVLTVFNKFLYGKSYPANFKVLLSGFAYTISLVSFFISFKIIYKKNFSPDRIFLPVLCFLLFYCSLISVLQHYILNTRYLANRTGLFLLVLFSFMFLFFIKELMRIKKIFIYTLPATAIFLTIHFCYSANLKYVFEYNLNADMKEMMHDIDSLKRETPAQKFCTDVGMSYDFLEPFNYYRCVYKFDWLNLADKERKNYALNDFYLFTEKEFTKIHKDSFIVIKSYPLFNSVLLKKKYKQSQYAICLSKKQDYDTSNDSIPLTHSASDKFFLSGKTSGMTDGKNEFSDGITYIIDLPKTPLKNSMVLVKAMILMEQLDNSEAWIIVSFENKKQIYFWHATLVNDFATKANEWFPVYFSDTIPPTVQQDDKLMIYLWNKKSPVYVDDMEMRGITGVY